MWGREQCVQILGGKGSAHVFRARLPHLELPSWREIRGRPQNQPRPPVGRSFISFSAASIHHRKPFPASSFPDPFGCASWFKEKYNPPIPPAPPIPFLLCFAFKRPATPRAAPWMCRDGLWALRRARGDKKQETRAAQEQERLLNCRGSGGEKGCVGVRGP